MPHFLRTEHVAIQLVISIENLSSEDKEVVDLLCDAEDDITLAAQYIYLADHNFGDEAKFCVDVFYKSPEYGEDNITPSAEFEVLPLNDTNPGSAGFQLVTTVECTVRAARMVL